MTTVNKKLVVSKLMDVADLLDDVGMFRASDYVTDKIIVKIAQGQALSGDDVNERSLYMEFLSEARESIPEDILNRNEDDIESAYKDYYNNDPTEQFERWKEGKM